MKYTKPFSDLFKKNTDIAGGKGASLGEMINAGIPVPDGFVVLSTTFENFLHKADLIQEIDAILESVDHKAVHSIDQASEKIQELIKHAEMPSDISSEIENQFTQLNSEFVAVRSSATAEDGADHAWAGQLESYLNTTQNTLLEKVQHCWASLFTPRAIFYRFEKGLNTTKISVAVVVQKMVNSEKSGIAFSVHPVTEDRNQIIIEAGFGLGEAIVSGSVTPDSYVVEKEPRKIIDINISNQTRAMYRKAGGGNEWQELGEKGGTQVFTEPEILDLANIIMTIENHYGFPCDIEWAFENGKFYIVQSRPITTLSKVLSPNIAEQNKKINWEKVLQRNFPPLAWTAGGYYEFHGLNVGQMTWIREREMQVKYNTVQSYMIQDPNAFYTTNINDLIQQKDIEFENAIDIENQKVMEIVEMLSGNNLSDLHALNEKHKLAYGLMLIGFDVAIDIRNQIDKTIKSKDEGFEAYLATPWKPTAIQREQFAATQAEQDIKNNPHNKNKILQKLANDFGYIHQDYLGQPWTALDYEKSFNDNITLQSGMDESYDLSKLNEYEAWLVTILKKMTYMYEEGRNAMVRTVWAMKETAKQIGLSPEVLLYMTASEVEQYSLGKMEAISDELVAIRKKYFAVHFDNGIYSEYSGEAEVKSLIEREKIEFIWQESNEVVDTLKGSIAFKGYAKGKVRLVFTQDDANQVEEGEILVSPMTQVEFLSGIRKCAAIITDEGGIICHAAIVSREFSKPCILATQKATKVLKNGDLVEVDANVGIVKLIK